MYRMNNNDWDNERYDEYEEVYQNALMTIRLVEENRALRRKNEYLQEKVDEHQNNINRQYQNTKKQVGNILSCLVDKASK